MKSIIWVDKKGLKHRSVLKDDMDESKPELGYKSDPPNVVEEIDWNVVAKDLHNELVDRGLFTEEDVITQQNSLTGAVLAVLKRKVKMLYKRRDIVNG